MAHASFGEADSHFQRVTDCEMLDHFIRIIDCSIVQFSCSNMDFLLKSQNLVKMEMTL